MLAFLPVGVGAGCCAFIPFLQKSRALHDSAGVYFGKRKLFIGTVFIYVDYTLPVEPVRQELQRILKESLLWNGKTCVLQVTDFAETMMQLLCLMSANSSSIAFDLRCHLREHTINFLQENYPRCLPTRRDAVTIGPAAGALDGKPPIEPHRTL